MKDLVYYQKLPYRLEIRPMEDAEGGFYACYPELGAHGDGPTIEEAIKEAALSKELLLEVALEHGDPIPEPEGEQGYSGKLNLRMPKSLHRQLAERAEREGVSLNQLLVYLLSRSLQQPEGFAKRAEQR